jgi:hypothetical protein
VFLISAPFAFVDSRHPTASILPLEQCSGSHFGFPREGRCGHQECSVPIFHRPAHFVLSEFNLCAARDFLPSLCVIRVAGLPAHIPVEAHYFLVPPERAHRIDSATHVFSPLQSTARGFHP